MKIAAVLFAFLALPGGPVMAAAEAVTLEAFTETGEGGENRRAFRFLARPGAGEVLAVHGTRWEDGRKVLEIEETVAAQDGRATFRIELTELAPDYWQLREPGAEQHIQGVRLDREERGPAMLGIELTPGTARRRYRFTWEARVETRPAANRPGSRQILWSASP